MITPTDEAMEDVALVGSPFEGRKVRFTEHLRLSSYWFGSNVLWGAFLGPVLSGQMTRLAPENSAGMVGLMYTVGAAPALVVPLVVGPLSDRCTAKMGRRRPFILWGALIGVLGLACMAGGFSMSALWLYLLGYLVIQVGTNIALAAYMGIIPDLVPADQRGIASGYMAVMCQLGTLFGALLSGILIDRKEDLLLYTILGSVFLLFLAITILGVPERPITDKSPPIDWSTYFKSLWIPLAKYPDFMWVWVTRALMMFGFYLISPYILYYLRDVIHVKNPGSTAGLVMGLILIGATISGIVGGAISDRTGRKPVVVASSVIISVMAVSLIFCKNLEQALALGLVFGVGYGAYISVDWALGTDVLPNKSDAAKDMSVWHVSMTLPQQIAPLASGLALGAFAGPKVLEDGKEVTTYLLPGYACIFSGAAFFFMMGAYLLRNVRKAR